MRTFKLFDKETVEALKREFRGGNWKDGRETATGYAKERKQAIQITETDKDFQRVFANIKSVILNDKLFKAIAFPRHVTNVRATIYRDGGHYDWHVDMAYMNSFRSDMSFTIFLSDPSEYVGGEMEFDFYTHKASLKGELGGVVLYPTGVLHRVAPVTEGERFVIVGWLESFIKDDDDREQLAIALSEIARIRTEHKLPTMEFDKLNRAMMHMRRTLST